MACRAPELLRKEKEFTRLRDQLSAERHALPWVKVEKNYVFDGPAAQGRLADLFDGRSQLVVKHFMSVPIGQKAASAARSSLITPWARCRPSRAPRRRPPWWSRARRWRETEPFRQPHGVAGFRWVSSYGSDFNHDFNVSFTPEEIAAGKATYNYRAGASVVDEMSGRSVFYKDEDGQIFHTYSSFARGGEMFLGSYAFLDITPKGRDETINGNLTDWVRHHDRYDDDTGSCCRSAHGATMNSSTAGLSSASASS